MVLFKSLHENCPDCGENNWKNPMLSDTIYCKDCSYETHPDIIIKGRKFSGDLEELELVPEYHQFSKTVKTNVEDRTREGWQVIGIEEDKIILGKSKKGGVVGHGVVALFTAPLTLGIGNAAYHEYKKRDMDIQVIRENDSNSQTETSGISDSLKELESLRDDQLISQEEFETKRSDLLEKL